MRKIISALLTLIILISACGAAFAANIGDISVSAKSAILINGKTGEVLYEKNPDSQMLIASTTKIMTAVVVLEKCRLNDIVTVSKDAAGVEGSSAYLTAGEKLTVKELLYCIMLSSGNDAATALAIHVSGSIEKFAEEMNAKAAELGLSNTSYRNPHGLDADGHHSTARDLAKLTAYALENEDFRNLAATKTAKVGSRSLTNHNRLLWELEGAIGVKTGYTKAAGRILVSAAERSGVQLICVTIKASDDWNDHKKLYEAAFSDYNYYTVNNAGDEIARLPVISGKADSAAVIAKDSVGVYHSEGDDIKTELVLPKFVYGGFKQGDKAGEIRVYVNGSLSSSGDIIYAETVEADESQKIGFWGKCKRMLRLSLKYGRTGTLYY